MTKHCVTKLNPDRLLIEPRPSPRFDCYNAWSMLDPPKIYSRILPAGGLDPDQSGYRSGLVFYCSAK
jgi:hypothetical protein